jgi:hypothetical protein
VLINNARKEKLRVILSFESSQDKEFEKKPAERFAKKFIEVYKEANNLK